MAKKRVNQDGEPRRRKRRMPLWQKIVFVGVLMVVGFVGYRITARLLQPIFLISTVHKEVRQLDSQASALKKENEALKERRKYLLSREGAEAEARKLNFVRPGERAIILGDEKKPEQKKD